LFLVRSQQAAEIDNAEPDRPDRQQVIAGVLRVTAR
jgi:hypothetical protein